MVGGPDGGVALPNPGLARGSGCGATRCCGGFRCVSGAIRCCGGFPGTVRGGASVARGGEGFMVRGACGVAGVARGAGRSCRSCRSCRSGRFSPARLRRSSSSLPSERCACAPLIIGPPARPIHAVPTRVAVIATGNIRRPKLPRFMVLPTFVSRALDVRQFCRRASSGLRLRTKSVTAVANLCRRCKSPPNPRETPSSDNRFPPHAQTALKLGTFEV